jgi:uncharacterized protein (TIGR02001 family)
MKQARILVASVALVAAFPAVAGDFSSTITATTDYMWRGVTQTAHDPAIQASLDFAADNGLYVGAWASNVDFGNCCNESAELDLYGGWSGGPEDGVQWDVGGLYYAYPGASDLDFPEVYAGLSYGMFSAKVHYSWDFFALKKSAYYIEGNSSVPLPKDFGLALHVGYSGGDAMDIPDAGLQSYMDWSVGVTKTLGKFDLQLAWVDGSDYGMADGTPGGVLSSAPRAVFSISTKVPW